MSENDDDSSKTEAPSDRKLRKARDKGDVPISRDVGHLMGFAGLLGIVFLLSIGPGLKATQALGELLTQATMIEIGSGQAGIGDLGGLILDPLRPAALMTAGALGVLGLCGLLAGLLQGPFAVSGERIQPKPDKISPMKGAKKLASAEHLVEFFKSLLKLMMIGAVGFYVVWSMMQALLPGAVAGPEWIPGMLATSTLRMLGLICALMVPVVIFDLLWKRYSHNKKQRMTIKEVRDEHKETEGDPQIAARRMQIRRQRSQQRISQAVPTATLVIANPTHYAVALRYVRGVDLAPVCVAKGTDLVAARIRQLAHDSEVPVIESPELARALHATTEVGHTIPERHWQAVAQLVNYVLDLRRRIRRKPPEGARLRQPEDEDTV
jgi:flagellar biosynthetic protein FlhB